MKITKVEQQKNNNKRYSIYIDNSFVFGLNEIDLLYFKIFEGNEITEERYEYIVNNVIFIQAKNKAFKYLEYKDRTEKEVYNKLKEYDYFDETILKVIELLKDYKYIDDFKYCQNFINTCFNIKGYGIKRIIYELKQKHIDETFISKAIEEIDFDESKKVIEIIKKRSKGNTEIDLKSKQRIYNFLLRRGFSYNVISSAFDEFFN